MRLGGSIFSTLVPDDLDAWIGAFDTYGLSAIAAPKGFDEMTENEAASYGERAAALGLSIGEAHSRVNLLVRDDDERARRIKRLRRGLELAEIMGAKSVCILVGTAGPEDHLAAPHPFNYTAEARIEFRDSLLRVFDGLDLKNAVLAIEPWPNTFFYQPAAIREFLDSVDHPKVGIHLDLMNMVDQYHYYRTTELINTTFDLLGDYVGAVHFKDLRWDWRYMYMKFDEVPVGEGVIDYHAYIKGISELGRDISCFVEHFQTIGEYAVSYAKLHKVAAELGVSFLGRHEKPKA